MADQRLHTKRQNHAVGDSTSVHADTDPDHMEFSNRGAIPPVAETNAGARGPTASERGFDDQDPDYDNSPEGRLMSRVEDQYGHHIEVAARKFDVPADTIRALICQESRGDVDANAGARQRDHGAHAASGLMQVTESTWRQAQQDFSELAHFDFHRFRYVDKINILVGTAVVATKRRALQALGLNPDSPQFAQLISMAYNAGEGLVISAFNHAWRGGSKHPEIDCLRPEFLKAAIREFPSVYSYYLTGGGKKANPGRSVERAIDLKYREISKYPNGIAELLESDVD